MAYSLKVRIRINNPSWEEVLVEFLRNFVVPLVPLFLLLRNKYRHIHAYVKDAVEIIATSLALILAVPIGLAGLAMTFGIPIILLCVIMGWIQ